MPAPGPVLQFKVEGAITEGSEFFKLHLGQPSEVQLDLSDMTYINSAGVKAWILWLTRLPRDCRIIIHNSPYVLVNQANLVLGFFPPMARVQSFQAFFFCPQCQSEKAIRVERGTHYDYATADKESWIKLPSPTCAKCGSNLEPDFNEAKAFQFLKPLAG